MVVGFLIGLATAFLGQYKDTKFEPFETKKFFRSPIIGAFYGILGAKIFPKNKSKLLLAGFVSTSERITMESWKALNGVDPGKFTWGPDRDRGWLFKKKEQSLLSTPKPSDSQENGTHDVVQGGL